VDDIKVSIENMDDLKGWMIVLPPTKIKVDGNGKSIIAHVEVETPRDWTLWTDEPQEITIKVDSEKANVHETYSTYLRQKGTYIPGFEPMITIIILSMIAIGLRRIRK
jgi:hypothetical protein